MLDKLPPFIQLYETENAKFQMHTGSPVRASVVYRFLVNSLGETRVGEFSPDTFLILEGYCFGFEVAAEQYPSLSYYLSCRNRSDIAGLWENFNLIDLSELRIVRDAYHATRRHVAETMTQLNSEEKKSD